MSLPGHVFSAYDGVRGFDTSEKVGARTAQLFYRAGYRFAIRYVRRENAHPFDLSASEAKQLLDAGLGVMLVQYVESESSWSPTAAKGKRNGPAAPGQNDSSKARS